MTGRKRWELQREDGVLTARLRSWAVFGDFLKGHVLENLDYIYRGHARQQWILEPTLDRMLRDKKASQQPGIRRAHLGAFRLAVRGRRGANPPALKSENDWWALGQHHGLATPLLDWTRSPYVAAYFAFQPSIETRQTHRVVFALQCEIVRLYCDGGAGIKGYHGLITPPGNLALPPGKRIDPVIPFSDENARLVTQNGLFTRAPDGVDIESFVREHFAGLKAGILVKILIPEVDRRECLQSLNRMNINHLSLFPDLYGASKHCNLSLSVPNY